jgi:hypothetical protein
MAILANPGFVRTEGITTTERYLQRICEHSFLSLWSHMGIFRDQRGGGTKGDGKELCDLLVVFGNDVLIFSDKACKFTDTGNLQLDWSRWFRNAVFKSADQIWGAERWIKEHPDRLFLDRLCTKRFPIDLPDLLAARFHRIVVAHKVSERCRHELGGSGSLMINTSIVGAAHTGHPFTIGQLDPARGFTHVLDDVTLDTILGTLDTASDFIRYLNKKAEAIQSGRLLLASGEEDLLAVYLREMNDHGEHDFGVPPGSLGIAVEEGAWANFVKHPQRLSQISADEVSYTWDALIETFTHHILAGTQYHTTHRSIGDNERGLRFMAREPRTRRRMLAEALYGLLRKTPHKNVRATRIVASTGPQEPYYVFLLLPYHPDVSDEQYRQTRERMLEACCIITKLVKPDAKDIVGIATETWGTDGRSEDFLYLDAREWGEQEDEEARRLQEETGLLQNLTMSEGKVYEYPLLEASTRQNKWKLGSNPRNKPCPCGSGKKYKKCCLS